MKVTNNELWCEEAAYGYKQSVNYERGIRDSVSGTLEETIYSHKHRLPMGMFL